MQALKNPLFLRPTSRPASPAPQSPSRPDSGIGFERARPLAKLSSLSSLGNFRRSSPAPTSNPPAPVPLVQDGTYLEMLSLKLSEAVSKALAPPIGVVPSNEQVGGKGVLPNGRGRTLGALIAGELKAAQDNAHLYRAIIRSLQRPLSVLATNLSSNLVPLLSTQVFLTPPGPSFHQTLTAQQLHAMGIANFAAELLETFDAFHLGIDSDLRGDGLKSVREGLASIIQRVMNPLVTAMKMELAPLLESLETPYVSSKIGLSAKLPNPLHPAITTMQGLIPAYARALSRIASSPTSDKILASFLISIVWRGLVALAHRPFPVPTPPPSPGLHSKRGLVSPTTTPPVTPPSSKFIMKLPSSRPPSPPRENELSATSLDAFTLFNLLSQLPRPSTDRALASEAVEEAFCALRALPPLIEAVRRLPAKLRVPHDVDGLVTELETLTVDLPSLIALPVLLQSYGGTLTVASILGHSEGTYRKSCLTGFGRADECGAPICRRVLNSLQVDGRERMTAVLAEWLDGEIGEARSSP